MALCGVDDFDLDPAATQESSCAEKFYTREQDGLMLPWSGRVWVNPPYSDIRPWVVKARTELALGNAQTVVLLLPANRTEQNWWADLIEPDRLAGRLEVWFLRGRRRFERPGWEKPAKGDRPPFGLVLIRM